MNRSAPNPDPIDQVALLADVVRRRVYECVVRAAEPLDRDAVAAATGISRSLAAFHLDRLQGAGLLEATFRRRTGRSGPGAGRPAKFYRRSRDGAVEVTLPPRREEVAADVFATALEGRDRGLDAVRDAAAAAGREAASAVEPGIRAGGEAAARDALLELMTARGFEPRAAEDGGIELGNCPFRALTTDHRELTCGANLALLAAVVQAFPGARLTAVRQEPAEPCCVRLRPAGGS